MAYFLHAGVQWKYAAQHQQIRAFLFHEKEHTSDLREVIDLIEILNTGDLNISCET